MSDTPPKPSVASQAAAKTGAPPPRQIDSAQLFAGAPEVHITHLGSVYRLKQTALRKLILTK